MLPVADKTRSTAKKANAKAKRLRTDADKKLRYAKMATKILDLDVDLQTLADAYEIDEYVENPNTESLGSVDFREWVRDYWILPWRSQLDNELVADALAYIRTPPAIISKDLQSGDVTPEFVSAWGKFHYHRGIVDCAYFGVGDGLDSIRSGQVGKASTSIEVLQIYAALWQHEWMTNEIWQKKWPTSEAGQLISKARRAFSDFVLDIVEERYNPPPNYPASWFEPFLGKKPQTKRWLSANFDRKLTQPLIEKLIQRASLYEELLPPLAWEGTPSSHS